MVRVFGSCEKWPAVRGVPYFREGIFLPDLRYSFDCQPTSSL